MIAYFAYGSNLSRAAMCARVPDARPLIASWLPDHVLTFESNEPQGAPHAFFANVRPAPGMSVPGALYAIDARGLSALDAYEDVARGVYARIEISVIGAGGSRELAIAYMMPVGSRPIRRGAPSPVQLAQIRAGYADWGLDLRVLEGALSSVSAKMA